jgi:predicted ArsR family transcriptional regulator
MTVEQVVARRQRVTARQLVEATGCSNRSARRAMARLVATGAWRVRRETMAEHRGRIGAPAQVWERVTA